MSEQHLIMAANPEFVAALAAATGGDAPDLATAVANASFEEQSKIMEEAMGDATVILQAHTAYVVEKLKLRATLVKGLEDLDTDLAEKLRARQFFTQTSNLMPLRDYWVPTSKAALLVNPGINKVPKDWAPAAV